MLSSSFAIFVSGQIITNPYLRFCITVLIDRKSTLKWISKK